MITTFISLCWRSGLVSVLTPVHSLLGGEAGKLISFTHHIHPPSCPLPCPRGRMRPDLSLLPSSTLPSVTAGAPSSLCSSTNASLLHLICSLLTLSHLRSACQRSVGRGRLTGSSFSSVWNTRSVTTAFVVNGISLPSGQEWGMGEDERSQRCCWW